MLDPGLLPLEASCPDAPLYWLTARAVDGAEVLVPAQAVFLFCNLDEPGLFLAGGSTGLASGNSLDEAKVAAITEILERDAEATTPFSRARCFTLRSRDQRIQSLLEDYAARGIRVQFQDLTTELGPAWRACPSACWKICRITACRRPRPICACWKACWQGTAKARSMWT